MDDATRALHKALCASARQHRATAAAARRAAKADWEAISELESRYPELSQAREGLATNETR